MENSAPSLGKVTELLIVRSSIVARLAKKVEVLISLETILSMFPLVVKIFAHLAEPVPNAYMLVRLGRKLAADSINVPDVGAPIVLKIPLAECTRARRCVREPTALRALLSGIKSRSSRPTNVPD